MKKVLIISTLKCTIESFLIPHIKLLEEMGYQVDLACNIPENSSSLDLENNRQYHLAFTRNLFAVNNVKCLIKLRGIIKRQNYEIIHLHTPIAAFIGRLAAHTLNIKNVIYTVHGFHFYRGAPLVNWLVYYPLEWIAMRWTDQLITINQEDYEIARKMASNRTKVYKVNGVGLDLIKYSKGSLSKIRRELRLSDKDFVVTIIGELNRNKNQMQLIKAIESLDDKFKVIIVGDGQNKNVLKKYVNLKKLESRVKFLGIRMDINDIISASDVMASMSYREGLPRNIMEGMAQGKPFIVTNIRGNRDIIKNGINGFIIELDRPGLTALAIKKLENKNLLYRIKATNLQEVKKYSNDRILENMKKIITGG